MSIPYRNSIIHDENPSEFDGDYQITDAALKNYNISREAFGSTKVLLSGDAFFTVKDYQYQLDNGRVGMKFLPVSDYESVLSPDKKMVRNYTVLDNYLRSYMRLRVEDQIYALISYFHPEQNCGTIIDLAVKTDKTEFGITHAGAYLGCGRTTNSPMIYHSNRFVVDGSADGTKYGYPANVFVVSMEGVSQAEFNKNAALADFCLNSGTLFPGNYKNAPFRAININTALMFYRDLLKRERYLFDDPTWFTYCAAHKVLVLTIAANLPHNLNSFVEVYGDEGAHIFDLFKQRYNQIVTPVPGFIPEMETNFEPLWKKQGFTAEQVRPFTKAEYDAFEEARRNKTLPSYKGKKALNPDQAVIWPPQSTAEVLYCFMQIYADFLDAGAVVFSQMLLGFMPMVMDRIGISKLQYLFASMPMIQEAMYADARIYAAQQKDTYLKERYQELFRAFGGKDADMDATPHDIHEWLKDIAATIKDLESLLKTDPVPAALAAWSMLKTVTHWPAIIIAGSVAPETAYVDMMKTIESQIARAEDYVVSDPEKIQYNTLPAIIHQIAIGMHPAGKFISVKEVCTVLDMSELELKK